MFQFLFPAQGNNAVVLDALKTLSIVFFLFVAGLEVHLARLKKQKRAAFSVSLTGVAFPFVSRFILAWFVPSLFGNQPDLTVFSLFFATALSISALPVITKTLMDLNLYKTDLGMITLSAAIFDDLVGWIVFAAILGMAGKALHSSHGILQTLLFTVGFALAMLTLVRAFIHRAFPWLKAYTGLGRKGVLGFLS